MYVCVGDVSCEYRQLTAVTQFSRLGATKRLCALAALVSSSSYLTRIVRSPSWRRIREAGRAQCARAASADYAIPQAMPTKTCARGGVQLRVRGYLRRKVHIEMCPATLARKHIMRRHPLSGHRNKVPIG